MHLELLFFTLHIFIFILSENKIKQTYAITSFAFQVYKMDFRSFLAQLVSILRVKLKKIVIRGKICFLKNFWAFLKSKRNIFVFAAFFSRLVLVQSAQFFSASTYHVFDEASFLYFSFNYQNAYGHQTFQGGNMQQGALTQEYACHLNGMVFLGHVKNKIHISTCRRCGCQTWPFNQVTNMSSRDCLKNLYLGCWF